MRRWSSSVKSRALGEQFAHLGVGGVELFVEPGQLRPHLQIAEILRRKSGGAPFQAVLRLPRVEQLAVARIALDHVLRIGVERMLQQETLFRLGERFGGLQRQLQKWIAGLAAGVLVHLRHHGGHQVESLAHVGEFSQDLDHAVVVFERVHARPGQLVLARDQVLIERLVHVPEEAEIDLRHGVSRLR